MSGTYARFCRATLATCIALTFTIIASAQTEKIVHSFTNGNDGGFPEGGLVSDGKGSFYGTAAGGGSSGSGVVFELSPNSSGGWTQQVIYNFAGFNGTGDGAGPTSSLVFDSIGNLYGVTAFGGTNGGGTVFELTPSSGGTWTEKVLYRFVGGTNAQELYRTGIVLDSAGNIFGTSVLGGTYGYGTVYELVAGTNGMWSEKVLYSFRGGNDGGGPYGTAPVLDTAGNLYGVAAAGGAHDYGVVYELTPGSGGSWTEKVLYSFSGGSGGASPTGSLLLDSSGNLFGTATYTAYELVRGSNGRWTEKTLHRFVGGKDGAYPESGMVFDKLGNLYGTTNSGGAHRGAVYELSPGANGTWTEKILHSFASNGTDGWGPQYATLAVDASGNVFGTTLSGGTSNSGVVFEIQP